MNDQTTQTKQLREDLLVISYEAKEAGDHSAHARARLIYLGATMAARTQTGREEAPSMEQLRNAIYGVVKP